MGMPGMTPPLPVGLRGQQGPMPQGAAPQQSQESPIALLIDISQKMRKLAVMLGQTKPAALAGLKQAAVSMSEVMSQLTGGSQGPEAQPPEVPPPTPAEPPAPPSESAAPGAGYMPGM